ncbi:MAG: SUF system Fe-S cluster assembly regulator [Myxococcales bacterium]|nr:SUF system Fe-S cluster assembly regulator [Myxococcales bacterium]HIK83526.1 SUF system Fe-S cluster assembly regulator [Myxococcales bacterium]
MFKLSKTTDYGIVLLARLARSASAEPQNARELAASSDLPVPMVSKVLKALAKEGLLVSHRGSKGGYHLARDPAALTVAEMIRVLEGPVGLTDCAIGPALCEHETMCAVREPWQLISRVVEEALEEVTLADLVRGGPSPAFDHVRGILQIEGRGGASSIGPELTTGAHADTGLDTTINPDDGSRSRASRPH